VSIPKRERDLKNCSRLSKCDTETEPKSPGSTSSGRIIVIRGRGDYFKGDTFYEQVMIVLELVICPCNVMVKIMCNLVLTEKKAIAKPNMKNLSIEEQSLFYEEM
jgi:hypothetical protein